MDKEMKAKLAKEELVFDEYGKPVIKDAVIIFKNFRGLERRDPETGEIRNSEGNRNFSIALNDKIAPVLADMGLNVKIRPDKNDPEAEPLVYVQVKVSYKFDDSRKPIITQFTSKTGPEGEVLDEDEIGDLDKIPYEKALVRFNCGKKKMKDSSGATHVAWLKNLNIVLKQDTFDKYWDYTPVDSDEEEDY